MAIKRQDVQLLESERLTDEEDGGGRMTGNEVPDGETNNLFPDVSRLDRTYGRVNLRKAFAAVRTDGTETYYGCHLAVAQQPEDENVSVLLFDTGSHEDERKDARSRIEAYLTSDAPYDMELRSAHLSGQRSLSVTAPDDADLPNVGETIQLYDKDGSQDEYTRVASIETEEKDGEQEVDIELARPLEHDWDPDDQDIEIRTTVVADAARYYGGTKLAEAAEEGDTTLRLESVYAPIVPATESEEAVSDRRGARRGRVKVDSGGSEVEFPASSLSHVLDVTQETRGHNWSYYLRPLPEPGTIRVSWRGLGSWMVLEDDGDGGMDGDGGGSVDYQSGSLNFSTSELPDAPSRILIEWQTPAHYRDGSGTVEARPPLITKSTDEQILPGTLEIEWVSGDETKTASDDGEGKITGDAEGRVAYQTGDIALTPTGAWPDSGSKMTATYDVDERQTETIDVGTDNDTVTLEVSNPPIRPGTVKVSWWVQRSEEWAITNSEAEGENFSGSSGGWFFIRWWSHNLTWMDMYSESSEDKQEIKKELADDGDGGLIDPPEGEVDYGDGTIIFKATTPYDYSSYRQSTRKGYDEAPDHIKDAAEYEESEDYEENSEEESLVDGQFTVEYQVDDPDNVQSTEVELDVPDITLSLKPHRSGIIIAGTVRFTWGDETYYDSQGEVYRESDDAKVGSIEYESGDVTLDTAQGADTETIEIEQMVLAKSDGGESQLMFRAPGSPLRPGSVSISATLTTGETISATSDEDGKLKHDKLRGTVDAEEGLVNLTFGYSKPLEEVDTDDPPPWYEKDLESEDGEHVWRPLRVIPESLRYSATIVEYLPLEADILGLDPIRLPQDGRVPIFRAADVAIIADPQTEELSEGAESGDEYDLSRDDLGYIELRDHHDEPVDPEMYETDLDAGTVKLTDDFDVSGYTEPLKVLHRKEEMVLISEVQVTGQVALSRSLNRSFPEGAQVASAMIVGDMRARVSHLFTQASWDSEWHDERQGDDTTASYDDINNPIEVTNSGAVPERWAIEFKDQETFRLIGENRGEIKEGDIDTDLSPVNPATGEEYFTLRAEGWGSGWSAGNVLRFNTHGANNPLWIARTVLAGETDIEEDQFVVQIRGDAQ